MLFSEPKIPQCPYSSSAKLIQNGFSALQRAENSSISTAHAQPGSRKGFSALQRAENSSIDTLGRSHQLIAMFQCSSASRKFLNGGKNYAAVVTDKFQCSSASRKFLNVPSQSISKPWDGLKVSVLFSEPKIPQLRNVDVFIYSPSVFQCSSASRKFLNLHRRVTAGSSACVSVLFSEPKIPQSRPSHLRPSIFPTAMITLRHS